MKKKTQDRSFTQTCINLYKYLHICTHTYTLKTHTNTYIHTYMYTNVHTHTRVHSRAHAHIHAHTHVNTCLRTPNKAISREWRMKSEEGSVGRRGEKRGK